MLARLRVHALFLVALLAAACGPVRPAPAPSAPPVAPSRLVVVTVRGQGALLEATGTLWDDFGHTVACATQDQRLLCPLGDAIGPGIGAHLSVAVEGWQPQEQNFATCAPGFPCDPVQDLGELHMKPVGVDPSGIPLRALAQQYRGSLFTARAPLSQGPRPYQPTNVVFWDLDWMTDADFQMAIDVWHQHHYTMAAIGPWGNSNDCYHGVYPCAGPLTPERLERLLDRVQVMWNEGIVPNYRHKPDNWETPGRRADLDALDAMLRNSPRAQKLLRVVSYPGWEPMGTKYGWLNSTYVEMLQRGTQVFPNALLSLHVACDVEVPVGGDDENPRFTGPPDGFAQAWKNITPYFHVFEWQSCGYLNANSPTPTPQFMADLKWVIQNQPPRTKPGGMWYGGSRWNVTNPGEPDPGIIWIMAEWASFPSFWSDWPESEAVKIGDAVMCWGADGYLDGGTVSVPLSPEDRVRVCSQY